MILLWIYYYEHHYDPTTSLPDAMCGVCSACTLDHMAPEELLKELDAQVVRTMRKSAQRPGKWQIVLDCAGVSNESEENSPLELETH